MSNKIKLFGASWCPACELIKQTLSENKVEFVYVDAGENPKEAQDLGIRSLPTIIVDDQTIINPSISQLRSMGIL